MIHFLKELTIQFRRAAMYAALIAVYGARRTLGNRGDIVMHGGAHPHNVLTWKVFLYLGLRKVRAGAGPAYYHLDQTTVPGMPGAINGRCTDISKSHVAAIFAQVAGYELTVDPRRWTGPMVCKSERNGAHDGVVIEGPIAEPKPGMAYQRLVDTRVSEDLIKEWRVGVIGTEIPVVFESFRAIAVRFTIDNVSYRRISADAAFSSEEQGVIIAFCRALGLDIGELDIMRDRNDGRIYIIDAAKTPYSLNHDFVGWVGFCCARDYARAFRRQFLAVQS